METGLDTGARTARGIWCAKGGAGDALIVLLHGIGGNAGVWAPTIAEIERRGMHRWLALDLRGHGRSTMDGPFGYGMHAGDVADAVREEVPSRVTILGHSFGGVVAALAGSGLFGPAPGRIAAVGVKLDWTAEEIARAQEIAAKPQRVFASRSEAAERFLKGAGLFGLADTDSAVARAGVVEAADGFRVAMDPRVFSAVGPSLAQIFALGGSAVRLTAGSKDPMVSLAAMQRVDPAARLLDGLGHNAHWEAPGAVLDFATGA